MAYRVVQCIISKKDDTYDYFLNNAELATSLYNAVLFRIRQIFTGYDKTDRTPNEEEVFKEIEILNNSYPSIKVKRVISYAHLEKLMRVNLNPDFFNGLPMQTAQQILKKAVTDFKDWLKALKDYKKNPSKYLGKPKMPRYKKNRFCTYTITNQDAVFYATKDNIGAELKLPLTKQRLYFSNIDSSAILKEVQVKSYYGRFLLCMVMEEPDVITQNLSLPNICAIDFGVDNFAAIVCNDSSSRIYKGGAVLANNQWFNKHKAEMISIMTKGHTHKSAHSKKLENLSFHHANFNKDLCHKVSKSIIDYCIEHKAGTIILGENKLWKQQSNIGSQNNQSFVSMPTFMLKQMITYKASNAGIKVILQEESYTSKADITSMDYIPTYGIDDCNANFSGSRIKRGLYKCASGLIVNADCNGAANIMRKAFPDIWKNVTDFKFLATPEVYGFHELSPLSIPVKGIAAA